MTKVKRTYKDTLFRCLFDNRKNLLSLYNAVNHTDYKNEEDLEINTLENANFRSNAAFCCILQWRG